MSSFLLTFFFLFSASVAQTTVPPSKTFKLINSGLIYAVGNDVYYTDVEEKINHQFMKLSNHPFNLCFFAPDLTHDQTSNSFTLAIRLDTRLVWIAQQTKPVGRNATLTFGREGNLVLTSVDGQVVWETGTANKGVADIKLLPNGNMVLLDKQGVFVWQSFHYPTDVLLVGQSLRSDGVNKLVSRMSNADPTPGPYSLVMEKKKMAFYYRKKNNRRQTYSQMEALFMEVGILSEMMFRCERVSTEPFLYQLSLNFTEDNSTWSVVPSQAQPHFNATYSFVQLGVDGNFRFHTYLDNVHDKVTRRYWEQTYALFSREQYDESECKLPEKCGAFGVCEDNQCVACPSPKGLMGWSNSCAPPKLPPCKLNGTSTKVSYYEVVGVDHFSSNYQGVSMKLVDCKEKCNKDCKCPGFFYRTDKSRCLIAPELNTLTRVSNSTHLAFIKISQ